jgi:Flp pilus assembly protein TadG
MVRKKEIGQVLAWFAVLFPLLIALVGLVHDGLYLWAQFRRARWAADGAAIAASMELNPGTYLSGGQVKLTPQAVMVAMHYAQVNDPQFHVTSVYVHQNRVFVEGYVEVRPIFLSLIGVPTLKLHIRGYERPAWGTTRERQ